MLRFILPLTLALFATTARAEVEIQEVTSPGGVNAWLVEQHEIPFLALEIRVRGGANLDEPGKRGAVNLMTAVIEEGAGERDAVAFQTAREELAASFSFSVSDDSFGVSARVLTENRDEALALLREALISPRFDQDAIDRVRAQVISGIQSQTQRPNVIASSTFNAEAFGDHPYGTALDGTIESVSALTRDDLLAAHRNVVTRDRLYVSAVGDITAEELGTLLDNLLSDLPSNAPALPPHVEPATFGGITVVPFPGPQSTIYFGHEGITRDDPDYITAYILNHILGSGGFESRLMQELREKRGLTYGVGTYLVPNDLSELIVGGFSTSNQSVAEAIELVRGEWQRLATEWVTQAELDRAKTYLTGQYPLRFDSNANIAQIMVGMQMIDLPTDYVLNRNDLVNAVTLQDLNRVASRILNPDALHFVVVGEPVGLDANQ
ncbi:M16 family metallopeptidase [Ketogulonicigenium vulgare]|uniref:Peptidase M16-like protein n=1 Tax=Ketogulonicigenium vulgare (strain WSH-001) TaxID=759362 RepID=F9Y4C9_KETVW|nr:pitrilysin family protein [Ketogulonicigenium vulgare]AEM41742.1 Peptidase M16-like protein [Ketogulonicigenium vulgare WSH-001]ALJ81850.1 zinc protease [Ketogulonicigenium vulgare]ANW34504.1 zinc protease [Ketogulonicigenium vulgare]AOZ55496.1 Peptidase M16-like protein [Ketogulonicigenium vulgare]